MSDKLPRVVRTGVFIVLGVEVKCHVLSDGTRVVSKDSLQALFEDGDLAKKDIVELKKFARFMKDVEDATEEDEEVEVEEEYYEEPEDEV